MGTITVTIKKKIAQNTTVPALNTPTPVVTATPAASPSNEPTAKPTATATATATPTPKVTPTPFPENPEFSNIPKGYTAKNQANKGEVERFEYESTEYISDDESAKRHQLTAMLWLFFQKTIQKRKNIRLFICSTD